MNYFTEYWYVWIIFAIMCVFLFSFYGKKFKQLKEKRKQYEEKLAQEKDMFSHLTSDVFDKIEPIDLTRAVIFHINAKEDRLYEDDNYDGNIIPYLTHEELLIYTMYQLECSLEGGRGSIHSFFITEPYCNYRPYYKEAFETMKCYDIAHLLEEAEKNTDLDMFECPFPVKYVLENGYRIYKDHVICEGKYDMIFGLMIDKKWYEI